MNPASAASVPEQDHHHLVVLFLRERTAAEQKRAQYDAGQKAMHGGVSSLF